LLLENGYEYENGQCSVNRADVLDSAASQTRGRAAGILQAFGIFVVGGAETLRRLTAQQ
jgi:hypothetical protein